MFTADKMSIRRHVMTHSCPSPSIVLLVCIALAGPAAGQTPDEHAKHHPGAGVAAAPAAMPGMPMPNAATPAGATPGMPMPAGATTAGAAPAPAGGMGAMMGAMMTPKPPGG